MGSVLPTLTNPYLLLKSIALHLQQAHTDGFV